MKKVIVNIFPFLLLMVSFASCLKGDDTNIDTDKTNAVIEFANTGDIVSGTGATYHRFFSDVGSVAPGDSATFNLNINYAGAGAAPSDITVQLGIDEAALESYNSSDGRSYVMPASSIYSFPSSVVIKKGTLTTQVKVAIIYSSDFDFDLSYALPIAITSASSELVSGNYGTCIFSFAVRNQYDGLYNMDGTLLDATSSSLKGYYPIDVELRTYTGNSVVMYEPVFYGNYYHIIGSGNTYSVYGNYSPIFYFDADGNITSVDNYYGTASTNTLNRQSALDPTGINKITFAGDGSIASIDVSYYMTQGGSNRTHFVETFTYEGAR